MASFNSGVYGGGSYQFESSHGGTGERKGIPGEIMFDDREYDEQPRQRSNVPLRRIGEQPQRPQRGGPIPTPRQRQEDRPEPFDDYRPGTMRAATRGTRREDLEGVRQARQIPRDEFEDDFEDQLGDFDDDFDEPRMPHYGGGAPYGRRPEPPRPGGRLSYSRYDDDYTDSDFEAEYSGLRGIGSSQRRPAAGGAAPQGARRMRDEFDYDEGADYDDYYGQPTMRDKGFDGGGVPRIFARYFDQQDSYEEERRRNGEPVHKPKERNRKNRNSSIAEYRRKKAYTAAAIVLSTVALAAGIITYLSVFRTSSPLNVATSLTSMTNSVSTSLLKTTVDGTLARKSIDVQFDGHSGTMNLGDCEFQYSTDENGTEEYIVVGQDVSGSDIKEKYVTMGTVKFNETKVREFLYELVGSNGVRMVEPSFDVKIVQDMDTKLYTGTLNIKAGTDGFGIDYETFISKLTAKIAQDDYTPIDNVLTTTVAPPVDIEKIYTQVHKEVADAYSVTDGAGNVSYVADVIGVDFDKSAAAAKISAGGNEWNINLALTLPKLTLKALRAETFPDLLSSYSSEFNAGNKARSSNVALSGDYINGTILQPGEVFSFNDVVGERTPGRGFSKATVYSSEGTDEDYGGGICQTSSTLFYAAMKANLEKVERTNHMYTVSYLFDKGKQVFGNDATVNWGYTDMKFANNKEYPIKIEVIVKSGVITCNIWGTWDGYTAEYRYVEKDTEYYQTIYRKYSDGKKNQAGQLGRTIWTYRVVFYEGEEVKRYREFESVYRPLSNIKYVTPGQLPAGCEYDVAY
ncbi:MAG: hypothetical protein E7559_06795 [Ruminococcaceae bacterium]|nr:hypothetical protein [Oscillospiraceae bacterium]